MLDGAPGDWLPGDVDVLEQGKGSLGDRLAAAFEDAWRTCELPLLLLGMDTPQVAVEQLSAAAAALHVPGTDAVLARRWTAGGGRSACTGPWRGSSPTGSPPAATAGAGGPGGRPPDLASPRPVPPSVGQGDPGPGASAGLSGAQGPVQRRDDLRRGGRAEEHRVAAAPADNGKCG